MTVAVLLPALDRFLEAATAAQKWRVVGPQERKLRTALARAFRTQGKSFVAGFAKLRGAFTEAFTAADWITIFNAATQDSFSLFLDPLQAGVEAALLAGATNLIAELGMDVSFSLRNPRAVAYVQAHGADLVRGIDDTTRSYLNTLLTQAADEGWSYQRTAEAITARYREFAVGVPQQHIRSRAELVATTELGNAYEAGNSIVVRDLTDAGLRMEKSWLTANDERVDPDCQANQDAGWIPFDETFPSGDMEPLAHPACRCTALYRRASG